MTVGERREFRMAWIFGPDLRKPSLNRRPTRRLGERLYLFQNLDGSGFSAHPPVDEDGIVLDYPALFQRVTPNRFAATDQVSGMTCYPCARNGP